MRCRCLELRCELLEMADQFVTALGEFGDPRRTDCCGHCAGFEGAQVVIQGTFGLS